MTQSKAFLDRAYSLDGHDETVRHYDAWAKTYDSELAANGYVTPERCANALARFASGFDMPVLDIGCGTGVSGKALALAGFTDIAGCDASPEMLALAERNGIYQHTWLSSPNDPLPFDVGTYAAITAVGVIGSGAAPVSLFHTALDRLALDGLMVLSLNDHALCVPEFPDAVDARVASPDFSLLMKEYGPHIPGKNLSANVYVIRRDAPSA